MREGELMFGCHLRKGYQRFYEKGAQNIPRKAHSTGK